jgi:tryptophan-rich sensory protein
MSKIATSVIKLVICVAACLSAGFIGSLFTTPAIPTWYAGLIKPPFSPPNWVFAPVWTTLYILMGVAAYLVWMKGIGEKRVLNALILYVVQLVLNASWSLFFFGLKSPLSGMIIILFLWAFILLTIIRFYYVSRLASYLMIPYLLWVSFASALNLSIWMLNPI